MATVTVTAVTPKKNGTTNGRKWTLFEVRAQSGKTYTTFDADWQRQVGLTVEATLSDGNRLGPPSQKAAPAPPLLASSDKFAMLNDKLDRLLADVAAIRAHFA